MDASLLTKKEIEEDLITETIEALVYCEYF